MSKKSIDQNLLLEGAEKILSTQGLDALNVRTLMRHLGYSVGAFYTVFPSLDDLILHINCRTLQRFRRELILAIKQVVQGVFFGIALPSYAAAFGGDLIWTTFATASAIFLLAMGYGVFTRSDLTSIGRILTFGVIGLIGVTLLYLVLSFFMNVTWLYLLISYVGLVVFVGLTAWDAQQIRKMSQQVGGDSIVAYKLALVMALRMYINVVMIFWYLLQIFSSSRR